MSNSATVTFTTDRQSGDLRDIMISSNPQASVISMANWLMAVASGSDAATINVKLNTGNATAASGTVDIVSPVTGDTLIVNGVSFIAGTDWSIGASDALSATALADAINASANTAIAGIVTASASNGVITITSDNYGYVGNLITLEGRGSGGVDATDSGTHASGTLTCVSVAANDTAVINGTTVTAVDKKEKTQVTAIAELGAVEVSTVTTVAETGAKEVSTVTTVADVAGSLNSTYFTFSAMNTGGGSATNYYAWMNINSAGVDPAVGGATGIEVAAATGASDADIATALRAAVTAIAGSKVVVTGATNQCIITNRFLGNSTNIADGGAATGFTLATTTPGSANVLNSKYFTFKLKDSGGATETGYYVWFNVNSEGVDPLVASHTAIPVAVAAGDSDSTIATALRAALTSAVSAKATISGATNQAIITGLFMGNATNIADGAAATGFTFATTTPGVASNLLNTYFTFYSASDATKYGIWCDVNGEGVAPTITGVSAGNRIAAVIAKGDSANNVAAALRLPFLSTPLSTDFTESGATDKLLFRNVAVGSTTNAADGASATGFAFSVTVAGGSVGATEFQIGDTNAATATALKTAINAQAGLSPIVVATAASNVATVTAVEEGVEGNAITLAATGGIAAGATRLAGGTESGQVRLSGGVDDTGSTTYNLQR